MAVGQNVDLKITFWDLMGINIILPVCSNLHFHLWPTFLHPSLPHPKIIVICKNTDVYSHISGCFFAYCIPSPCTQKDNYHPTSSSRSMQSRLIISLFPIPFTPLCLRTTMNGKQGMLQDIKGERNLRTCGGI